MQEVIPPSLLDKNKVDEFIVWLKALWLDWEDRKQLLMFWADRVGLNVTAELIKKAWINYHDS
ncbi:hypothetical protein ES703_69327 [subsurface metagenome]